VPDVRTVVGDQLDDVGAWFQAGAGQAPRAGQLPQRVLLLHVPACRPDDPLGLVDHLKGIVVAHDRSRAIQRVSLR
jgi:hypothetical protein